MSYFYDTNLGFPTEVYQPNENPVIFYPVVNQVYFPESQFYKVVHAVEYHGTTYFYESIMNFPVYHLYNTISYTPEHNVGGNTSYWPTENIYTDNVEEHIENISDSDFELSLCESLLSENNVIMAPPMNESTFFSPELDVHTSVSNNYWSAAYDQSQYDTGENCHRNAIHSTEIYQKYYSEQFVTWNEGTLCYEQVNYGLYQFSNGMSLEEGSANGTMQEI